MLFLPPLLPGAPGCKRPKEIIVKLHMHVVLQSLKMIQLAVSLGGVKSLIEVASGMTHPDKYMSSAERLEGGLGESLIRFRCVIIRYYMQE